LRTAQQGKALSEASGHIIDVYNIEGNMIWANLQLGNFAEARQLTVDFGERARRTGMQVELLFSLYTQGVAEIYLGDRETGVADLCRALTLAESLDNKVRQIFIHHYWGKLSIDEAMYDQALSHFQQALRCAQDADLTHLQNFAQAGLALTYLHISDMSVYAPHQTAQRIASQLQGQHLRRSFLENVIKWKRSYGRQTEIVQFPREKDSNFSRMPI